MLVCDTRVVSLLKQNSFGNSSFQLQEKKLTGQHHEVWLQRTAHYLTDCQTQLVLPQKCGDPLPLPLVPKAAWLLTVYCRDVLARLEEVKASITATFGRVLKINSTKKQTKMPKTGPSPKIWLKRLTEYAQGSFQFERGQRPRKNSYWAKRLQAIERCPKHKNPGNQDALERPITCTCGFHGPRRPAQQECPAGRGTLATTTASSSRVTSHEVPSSVAQLVPTEQVPSRVSTSVAGVCSGVIISGTRYECYLPYFVV